MTTVANVTPCTIFCYDLFFKKREKETCDFAMSVIHTRLFSNICIILLHLIVSSQCLTLKIENCFCSFTPRLFQKIGAFTLFSYLDFSVVTLSVCIFLQGRSSPYRTLAGWILFSSMIHKHD